MPGLMRSFLLMAALASVSAHVCVSTRTPSGMCRARASVPGPSMIFGKKSVPDRDEVDLGPMTREKRAIYKTDRTPKTQYVPDDLRWDGSQYYALMLPLLFVICLSLFGGVNLFGYS
mmetsp:Transcript_1741/g.4885  ORF Transcript_1741/g.4885 Transcript_1741/m.4885 type:complete len:117 (-) Transcript_1741:304-654(-)|eukprot:CAMPEP_0185181634 /NCGR_PEP_ID=MMETSP1140-20130426/566_1 /TAXON_ID=298111 /ORGANISM="Pavlova sp., Strain CCMP459" /LENGTH=116 /DNA_ID=CAMNT_0027747505 /DNA_START=66 /DNA_END=416 /DNA_ORIENTATION=+